MLALYKIRFQIDPAGPQSVAGAARECLEYMRSWVDNSYGRSRLPSPGIKEVSDLDPMDPNPQLRSTRLECGAFNHSFSWRRRDDVRDLSWTTVIDLVSDSESLDFQMTLGAESSAIDLDPPRLPVGGPKIISTLISHPRWKCRVGDEQLTVEPLQRTVSQVEDLCSDELFREGRSLPVVVVTPCRRPKRWPVNPATLAQRLCGTARVIRMFDELATTALDQFLGRDLAVGSNSVRVFAPGLMCESRYEGHWHFLGDTIKAKGLTDIDFSDFLFRRLAERSLSRFRESPLISRFRQLANSERARVLEAAKAAGRENDSFYEEYASKLEEQVKTLEADKRELEEALLRRDQDIDQLGGELEAARLNLRNLSEKLARPEVEHAEVPISSSAPQTVASIVEEAAGSYANLLVLDSAIRSAAEVPTTYKFPDRVAEAIRTLQEAASEKACKGRVENGLRKYFKARGFEYKPNISDTTRNTWGDDYRFLYEGERVLFEEHFTIGVRSANTCVSLHFSTRLRPDKIVLAYVGRHLRNTQS